MAKHPDLEPPRQVILRSRCWNIPKPASGWAARSLKELAVDSTTEPKTSSPDPWEWEFERDVEWVRWRPWRTKPNDPKTAFELYQHVHKQFESKTPTRPWPNRPPTNPWSA